MLRQSVSSILTWLCIAAHLAVCGVVGPADLVACESANGDTRIERAHNEGHRHVPTDHLSVEGDVSAERGMHLHAEPGSCVDKPIAHHSHYVPKDEAGPTLVTLSDAPILFELPEPAETSDRIVSPLPLDSRLPAPPHRLRGVILLL
jgi:hypothetical protein